MLTIGQHEALGNKLRSVKLTLLGLREVAAESDRLTEAIKNVDLVRLTLDRDAIISGLDRVHGPCYFEGA